MSGATAKGLVNSWTVAQLWGQQVRGQAWQAGWQRLPAQVPPPVQLSPCPRPAPLTISSKSAMRRRSASQRCTMATATCAAAGGRAAVQQGQAAGCGEVGRALFGSAWTQAR